MEMKIIDIEPQCNAQCFGKSSNFELSPIYGLKFSKKNRHESCRIIVDTIK